MSTAKKTCDFFMCAIIDSNNASDLFMDKLINISKVQSDSPQLGWAYGSMPLLILSLMSGYIIRYVLLKNILWYYSNLAQN